ncbi:phosphate starvation-inducible protein PhoH [Aneurinibacillus migulanus]|uniref:PhoH-like protein n=1 Tax=Aneurinibacillus migulanus TaxID=47500 RepID=A0A0D1VB64_ANEMI|nr:PhoH family protein [Aneurinibacillus migulanus]KIV55213.1 phosphate starvation protein PhoH [Aneurinibacillus migulanus]KIV56659.1 phosphate starvation protein PhoH [Aneurinibacillus migulanus]KON95421.1 phosphate starvation protein PhoH [Aneurinibacillus migulanus]KPD06011.1 phosphate starvation-inducible protein PhoH [Aneurinibacillus migulanus]MCP1355979.1 PhoH family protein [Aneurinibacillus migulanus]
MHVEETSKTIRLESAEEASLLFGPQDSYLKEIENATPAHIFARSEEITISGLAQEVERNARLIEVLASLLRRGIKLSLQDVLYAIQLSKEDALEELMELYDQPIATSVKGKPIRVKTLGQRHYVTSIKKKDIVFGIGPAGTGKTYLAVVMAVTALKANRVKRIVLTRPAVEAGENLGFLPGDLQEKVDPYLRPLYDALQDLLSTENMTKYMERGIIEVAPLAYMRGRTLDDSFIILDEAQNTTPEQMKMFLTRLGFGSKMVITGDVTQVDLPRGKKSGLQDACRKLEGIEGISFVYLTGMDVVRHPLVQKVITAYEQESET